MCTIDSPNFLSWFSYHVVLVHETLYAYVIDYEFLYLIILYVILSCDVMLHVKLSNDAMHYCIKQSKTEVSEFL